MENNKTYILSAIASATHNAGERTLYKVDPKDGGPTTYCTLQRHDWVYNTGRSNSYYVVVATGKRIPSHVVSKWLCLGYLAECTSPVSISSLNNPKRSYSLAA